MTIIENHENELPSDTRHPLSNHAFPKLDVDSAKPVWCLCAMWILSKNKSEAPHNLSSFGRPWPYQLWDASKVQQSRVARLSKKASDRPEADAWYRERIDLWTKIMNQSLDAIRVRLKLVIEKAFGSSSGAIKWERLISDWTIEVSIH